MPPKTSPPQSSTKEESAAVWEHQERCRALLECREQLKYWRTRQRRLKAEHKKVTQKLALKHDAAAIWHHLSRKEQRSPENLLLIMTHSPNLPEELKSKWWWQYPSNDDRQVQLLQGHADLWRARLQRKECSDPDMECITNEVIHMLTTPNYLDKTDLWDAFLVRLPSMLRYKQDVKDFLAHEPFAFDWVKGRLVNMIRQTKSPEEAFASVRELWSHWETALPPPMKLRIEDHNEVNTTAQTLQGRKKHSKSKPATVKKDEATDDVVALEDEDPRALRAKMLRNDPELQRAIWERPCWTKTPRDLLGSVLRNDKEFGLQLPALSGEGYFPPDGLAALSHRLQADKDVVMAFCKRHGGNLAYASLSLRRHYGVVTTSLQTCPASLKWCLKTGWKHTLWKKAPKLLDDCRKTGLLLLPGTSGIVRPQAAFYPEEQCAVLWKLCPAKIKEVRGTVVEAARMGLLTDTVTEHVTWGSDSSFWMDVLRLDASCAKNVLQYTGFGRPFWNWENFHPDIQTDANVARQWLHYHSATVLYAYKHRYNRTNSATGHCVADFWEECVWWEESLTIIFRNFPNLVNDEVFLEAMLTCETDDIKALLPEILIPAGLDLTQHRSLVERCCSICGLLLDNLPLALQADEEIVKIALATQPEALTVLPETVQIQYPSLVAGAIEGIARKIRLLTGNDNGTFLEEEEEDMLEKSDVKLDLTHVFERTDYFDLEEYICEDLWENRDVAMAWVRAGGEFIGELYGIYEDDEEFALAVAEFCPIDFDSVSHRLRNDENFIRQAVVKNGRVLLEAAAGAISFDVTLLAFATHANMVKYYEWTNVNGSDFEFLTSTSQRIRQKLLECHSFEVFLQGFCVRRSSASKSPVELLECGRDTAYMFKKLIADFLGNAVGSELALLRQASNNLAKWGF